MSGQRIVAWAARPFVRTLYVNPLNTRQTYERVSDIKTNGIFLVVDVLPDNDWPGFRKSRLEGLIETFHHDDPGKTAKFREITIGDTIWLRK